MFNFSKNPEVKVRPSVLSRYNNGQSDLRMSNHYCCTFESIMPESSLLTNPSIHCRLDERPTFMYAYEGLQKSYLSVGRGQGLIRVHEILCLECAVHVSQRQRESC